MAIKEFSSQSPRSDSAQNRTRERTETEEPPKKQDNKNDNAGGNHRFMLTIGIGAIALVLLFVIGIVPRLRARKTLANQNKQAAQSLAQTEVVYPKPGPRVTTLTLPANIQPVAETDISARASGYVHEWKVDIGDKVKQGQVLAILDTPDADQQVRQAQAQVSQALAQLIQQRAEAARAVANLAQSHQNAEKQRQQLLQAQADLNLAKLTADRYRYMLKEGAVSQQSTDEQVSAYNNNKANVGALQAAVQASKSDIAAFEAAQRSAEANVQAAEANVSAARANARRFDVLVAFKKVRAPFSGIVTSRSVDAGTLIGGGSGSSESSNGGAASGGGGASASGGIASASSGAGGSGTVASNGANSSRGAMYNAAPGAGSTTGAPAGNGAGAAATGSGTDATAPTSGMVAARPAQSGGSAATSTGASAPTQAPFNGQSGGEQGPGGAVVSPGTSLYHIAQVKTVRIQVNVPQSFAPNIHVGGHTKILVQEYPDTPFEGKVARTASSLDPQTRTMLTEIVIPNPSGRLLPGMYGQVVFNVERTVAPLIIPDSALLVNANGTQVATVGSGGKVQLKSIVVGRDFGRESEVISGLSTRDQVVVSPTDQTRDGMKVQPITPEQKKQMQQQAQKSQQGQASKESGGQSQGQQPRGNQGQGGGAGAAGGQYGGGLNDSADTTPTNGSSAAPSGNGQSSPAGRPNESDSGTPPSQGQQFTPPLPNSKPEGQR